jgi:hypothetical protein
MAIKKLGDARSKGRHGMDRKTILEYLGQAERHVAESGEHVARQREIVAELARQGSEAQELLQQFELLEAEHVADRDRLLAELERFGLRDENPAASE